MLTLLHTELGAAAKREKTQIASATLSASRISYAPMRPPLHAIRMAYRFHIRWS